MRAMAITGKGSINVLKEIELPTPEPHEKELLVKVKATSINPYDISLRRDMDLKGMYPFIAGGDVSGVIEKVGKNVRSFKEGDEVFYMPPPCYGSYAEYHIIHEDMAARKPSNISHTEAASFPLAALTAWQGLYGKLRMLPSEKLLILGAGGVGLYVLQLAKISGAFVIASGGDGAYEISKKLGADIVLNYKKDDVMESVMKATNNGGVDLIYDCIGGDTLAQSVQAIKKGAYTESKIVTITTGSLEINFGYEIHCLYVKESKRDLSLIADLIERGMLKPIIDSTFSFRDIPKAHEKFEKGGIKGKVVIDMEKD